MLPASDFYLSDKKEFINVEYNPGMLTEDDLSNLYLPFTKGGLIVFKKKTEKTTQFAPTKFNKTYSLFFPKYKNKSWISSDGHIYEATLLKDKLKIDTKQDFLTSLNIDSQQKIVWMLEAKNILFVKTQESSIFVIKDIRPVKRLFTTGFMKQMCLSLDSQYLYYINTTFDICRFDLVTQKEDTLLITPMLQKINFNYTDPKDIADDGKGNIWITSQNGLIRYDVANKSVETYTMANGLSNNFSFVNDMAAGITKNCVEELSFTNCTVYILKDEKKYWRKLLIKMWMACRLTR